MKLDLDRKDLINLVNSTMPNMSVMYNKQIDKCGKFCDNRGWTWNEYKLKELTDIQLYHMYLNCKKSWK